MTQATFFRKQKATRNGPPFAYAECFIRQTVRITEQGELDKLMVHKYTLSKGGVLHAIKIIPPQHSKELL